MNYKDTVDEILKSEGPVRLLADRHYVTAAYNSGDHGIQILTIPTKEFSTKNKYNFITGLCESGKDILTFRTSEIYNFLRKGVSHKKVLPKFKKLVGVCPEDFKGTIEDYMKEHRPYLWSERAKVLHNKIETGCDPVRYFRVVTIDAIAMNTPEENMEGTCIALKKDTSKMKGVTVQFKEKQGKKQLMDILYDEFEVLVWVDHLANLLHEDVEVLHKKLANVSVKIGTTPDSIGMRDMYKLSLMHDDFKKYHKDILTINRCLVGLKLPDAAAAE